jgi:hypothetical protein
MMGENGWKIMTANSIRPGFQKGYDPRFFGVGLFGHDALPVAGFCVIRSPGRTKISKSDNVWKMSNLLVAGRELKSVAEGIYHHSMRRVKRV